MRWLKTLLLAVWLAGTVYGLSIEGGVRFETSSANVTYLLNESIELVDYLNITSTELYLGDNYYKALVNESVTINLFDAQNQIRRRFSVFEYYDACLIPEGCYDKPSFMLFMGGLYSDKPISITKECTLWPNTYSETVLVTSTVNGSGNFNFTIAQCPNYGIVDPVFDIVVTGDTCLTDKYSTEYNYNLTFKKEEDDSLFNFSEHGTSYIDIICPTYGSDRETLTDVEEKKIYYTKEHAIFSLKTDNQGQLREMTMRDDVDDFNYYLVDGNGQIHTFSLLDYTNTFGSSILKISTTTNYTLWEVDSAKWDSERNVRVTLRNETPYKIQVIGTSGNIRDFGFMSFPSSDTNHNIEIYNPDLSNPQNQLDGLATSFIEDYNLSQVGYSYETTEGTVDSIDFFVYAANSTPYSIIYISNTTNTTSGVFLYTISNRSIPYQVKVNIHHSEYGNLEESLLMFVKNDSAMIIDMNLPSSFLGVSSTAIYRGLSLMIVIISAFAFSAVTQGLAGIIILVELLFFNYIGWLPIHAIILSIFALFVILNQLSSRRHKT